MKILKIGDNAPEKVRSLEVTCDHCHSVLEIAQDDVTPNKATYGVVTKCPVCGRFIEIDDDIQFIKTTENEN